MKVKHTGIPFLLFLFLALFTLTASAQNQDSRAGDEAALEDLYVSMNRPGMEGWGTDMSLDGNIEGVTVATIGGELRVTEIDLRRKGLTGSIDNESLANLKELTLWNSALNNFDTQYPSAIHQIGSSLEYLYITYSNASGNFDPYMPHEWTAPDGPAGNRTAIHQGKWQGDERSVIRGSVPDDIDNLTNLKYFHLSWTDDWGDTRKDFPLAINGIESVSENIWNITTLESISLYENWNIGKSGNTFSFPNSIAHLTELRYVYLGGGGGSEYDADFSAHYMVGGPPSDLGQLTKIRAWVVEKESNFSGPFPDLRNSPNLEILQLPKTGIQGQMPSWLWDGGFEWFDSFAISHPIGDKMSGTFPDIDPDAYGRMDNFAITDHEFSGTVPVGLWDANISKVNIGQNRFTSLGRQDFSSYEESLFWIYYNDIEGEQIPYFNWGSSEYNQIRIDGNRYVFQDMLYVPPNSPNGETAIELYWILEDDANLTGLSTDNQRPAGPSASYTVTGGDIVIDDHVSTYGHADNSYQWQKDGVDISDGGKFSGTNTKTLTIKSSDADDVGAYELVVNNSLYSSLASRYGKSNMTLTSRPIKVDNSGEGSNGDAPAAPDLNSPEDGATSITTTTTLDWNSVSSADSYRLQVATTSDFSSTVTDASGLTATQMEVGTLNYNTVYYWRVQAVNENGSSDWSTVYNFTTEQESASPPDIPTLVSPSNGATEISTSPTLDWEAASGAESYRVQVATNSDFSTVVADQSGLSTTQQQASGLANATTYFWRVQASNAAGSSDWSTVWSFTTASETSQAIPAPVLISPTDGATGTSLTPTFSWEAVDGADYYVLHANRLDPGEMIIEQQVNGTTFTPSSSLDPETDHDWRVRAVVDSVEGTWSPIRRFVTGTGEDSEETTNDTETSLGQNYPNPFNPSTQIRFSLAETQQVSLKVYDTVGREVATIVEGTLSAGSYERTFQADNLASGVYFLRFITENRVLTSQMTLMK